MSESMTRIRLLHIQWGLTKADCRRLLGISKSSYYEYCNGDVAVPKPVERIMEYLSVLGKEQRTFYLARINRKMVEGLTEG